MAKQNQKRTFFGVLLIPLAYILTEFLLDFALFAIIGIPFPKYWATSFLLVLVIALIIACIPSRGSQITIFSFIILCRAITTVGNLVAYENLGEIFILETLRSFRELLGAADAARYDGTWHFILVGLIVAAFVFTCAVSKIKFRRQRPGFPPNSVAAVLAIVIIISTGIIVQFRQHEKNAASMTNLERLIDEHYSITDFSNRSRALYSFGSPLFYCNNLMSIIGLKNTTVDATAVKPSTGGWEDVAYYGNYEHKLDKNYNLIMLMFETGEYNGIDPVLTENLWKLRGMSSWSDEYYSIERTAFSEYISLNGIQAMGAEMWRDYTNVNQTVSLPNIFRRAWENDDIPFQIGGFHTFEKEFYNRDLLFKAHINGMDFMRDMETYHLPVNDTTLAANSDAKFVAAALNDIAPTNKRFMSYFLNVSTHAPHFNAKFLRHEGDTYTSDFPESLAFVLSHFDTLAEKYPKMKSSNRDIADAAIAYVVSLREYDTAIGILLNHLESTGLIDKTAIVLYGDHYDYVSYANMYNPERGSLLSNNNIESPIGEKLAFMVYNPRDKITGGEGRKIDGFMANNDIYKTVCHLFDVQTNKNFTLGNSILARINNPTPPISVGIAFYKGQFFGTDIDDPSIHWSTRDFKTYETNNGVQPSQKTIRAAKARMETYAGTIFKTRPYFQSNYFREDRRCYYQMGTRH
jgi:hypothetical protein